MCFQQMVKSVFSDREREDPDHWKICQYNIVRYLIEVFLSNPTLTGFPEEATQNGRLCSSPFYIQLCGLPYTKEEVNHACISV